VRLRNRRNEDPEINLTPLIDVVFLLLIFFMVTTTFMRESSLEITLPQASPEAAEQQPEVLDLVVNADGEYALDGRTLVNRQAGTLRRALEEAIAEGDRPLVIRADANAPHQAVVTALDVAGQMGIERVSIGTMREGD